MRETESTVISQTDRERQTDTDRQRQRHRERETETHTHTETGFVEMQIRLKALTYFTLGVVPVGRCDGVTLPADRSPSDLHTRV